MGIKAIFVFHDSSNAELVQVSIKQEWEMQIKIFILEILKIYQEY